MSSNKTGDQCKTVAFLTGNHHFSFVVLVMMQNKNGIQFYLHVYKMQIQAQYMSETYGMIFYLF